MGTLLPCDLGEGAVYPSYQGEFLLDNLRIAGVGGVGLVECESGVNLTLSQR